MEHTAVENATEQARMLFTDINDVDLFVKQMLNIGEAMQKAGSEIARTEETLYLLGKAYGASHIGAYALPGIITVTVELPGYPAVTQQRRIYTESVDLKKLNKINALCRECAIRPLPIGELQARTTAILSQQPKQFIILIGSILLGSFFCLFFGGSVPDALVAGTVAILIWLLNRFLRPLCSGQILYYFLAAFIAGSVVCVVTRLFPSLHRAEIMIGDIMLLIPGMHITNSLRYIISGNPMSGVERLVGSLIQTASLAAGFTLAMFLLGGLVK